MNPKYESIRHSRRPASWHPKMRRQDRAKLFAPFAALSGFEDSVHAREAILSPRMNYTESIWERLNQKLRALQKGDYVTVIYFLPVKMTAEGAFGEYLTVSSLFLRIDEAEGTLCMDGATIPIEDIAEITGETLESGEDYDGRVQ